VTCVSIIEIQVISGKTRIKNSNNKDFPLLHCDCDVFDWREASPPLIE
jgi:hypothetical protein